jgi:hypothetical protein
MAEIIPLPALQPPSPDDYRAEPATILILPIVRVEREDPLVSEVTEQQVQLFMDQLNKRNREATRLLEEYNGED